jgi:hypothetical protein
MKWCLEGGSSKKPSENETGKAKKLFMASSSVQIVNSWAIGKTTQSVHLMGPKKASFFTFVMSCPPCLYCCAEKGT